MQVASPLNLKIGEYEVHPIATGIFSLDGGAMFGTVPKNIWQKTNPADEQNRIAMEARALLLLSTDKKILVDVGNGGDFVEKYGEKLGSKFAQLYNIGGGRDGLSGDGNKISGGADLDSKNSVSLKNSLLRYGLKLDDITDVILTHLHFDHAGGGTYFDTLSGGLAPAFKNATYYIQKTNLETAQKPNLREKASYFAANFEPLIKAGVLKILNGEVENLLPQVSVYISNGHTQGQQIVKVSDGKNTILYCGDMIPTSSHIRLPFVMGYDLHPLLITEEKESWLKKAAAENWYLFFEHDPKFDCAQVVAVGSDFQHKALFSLS